MSDKTKIILATLLLGASLITLILMSRQDIEHNRKIYKCRMLSQKSLLTIDNPDTEKCRIILENADNELDEYDRKIMSIEL